MQHNLQPASKTCKRHALAVKGIKLATVCSTVDGLDPLIDSKGYFSYQGDSVTLGRVGA